MINIFWFRRDLRLNDNHGLYQALNAGLPVLPVFIFDTNITGELQPDDPRLTFIYETLFSINSELKGYGGSVLILQGDPVTSFEKLLSSFEINAVFTNKDYEPYAIERDNTVGSLLRKHGIKLFSFKDQVIFEEKEIVKGGGDPYTVFTPYKKKWLGELQSFTTLSDYSCQLNDRLFSSSSKFPSLEELGFSAAAIKVKPYDLSVITDYDKFRDYPAEDRTSYLGPHLRFGTISIRKLVNQAKEENSVFLGELIWREFFMQILFNFPAVVTASFRRKYDSIIWRNNENEFESWCRGETGYPIVDAGMRQLNETGFMHNRVRMIAAGFLCKHLLVDWRWGEAYFASKLLDYELSSNNGNWQWAAGTGCDAVPYFRVFNPSLQHAKYDPRSEYVIRWIPVFLTNYKFRPVVDHDFARQRAINAYKAAGLQKTG